MSKILIKMMCEDNLHHVTVGHIYILVEFLHVYYYLRHVIYRLLC